MKAMRVTKCANCGVVATMEVCKKCENYRWDNNGVRYRGANCCKCEEIFEDEVLEANEKKKEA